MTDKNIRKVETMFEYGPADVEEAKRFIVKIEGTDAFWHLIAMLIVNNTHLKERLESAENKIEELEKTNEKVRDSFGGGNEYRY